MTFYIYLQLLTCVRFLKLSDRVELHFQDGISTIKSNAANVSHLVAVPGTKTTSVAKKNAIINVFVASRRLKAFV